MEARKAKPRPVAESSNIPRLWREGLDYAAKRQETSIDEKKDDGTSEKQGVISYLLSLVFGRQDRR
jgi:hypothetical protein